MSQGKITDAVMEGDQIGPLNSRACWSVVQSQYSRRRWVWVEPSLCPVPRMPSMVDSVSPQVQVEPAGSQVAGFAMGRFANRNPQRPQILRWSAREDWVQQSEQRWQSWTALICPWSFRGEQLLWNQCFIFSEGSIAVRWSLPWKKQPSWIRFVKREVGAFFSCCHGSCCTGPPRGGNIHKSKLAERFQAFAEGQWSSLLRQSRQYAEEASTAQHRKRRRQHPQHDLDRRATRAEGLVQLGVLSAGRQALEGVSIALGTSRTLDALRDPSRRWARSSRPDPRSDFESGTRGAIPARRIQVRIEPSSATWSRSRTFRHECRAHATRVGMSETPTLFLMAEQSNHPLPMPYDWAEWLLFRSPTAGWEASLRVTSWGGWWQGQSPNKWARWWRLPHVTPTCHVYSGRVGVHRTCDSSSHWVESSFDGLSIDGVGAHDSISRKAMLEALVRVPGGSQVLLLVRLFHGRLSLYQKNRTRRRGWTRGCPHALALFPWTTRGIRSRRSQDGGRGGALGIPRWRERHHNTGESRG